MKVLSFIIAAGLVAVCSSASPPPVLSPPKQPSSPFFNLQIVSSPNASLVGWWITAPDDDGYLTATPNRTDRALFYQSARLVNREHPDNSSVLVHKTGNKPRVNSSLANTIFGQSDEESSSAIESSVFSKTQDEWDDFGGYQADFGLNYFNQRVRFNAVQADGAIDGWNKTSFCTFNIFDFTVERLILINYYPGKKTPDGICSEVHLSWVFAGQ